MKIIDMTECLSKNCILTGRSALAYRNFGCSSDPRVIMTAYNGNKDIYFEPRWLIPKEENFETEIFNGTQIATLNQSLYHTFKYDYDDSVFSEIADIISDEELMSFWNWLNQRKNLYNNIINKILNSELKDELERILND